MELFWQTGNLAADTTQPMLMLLNWFLLIGNHAGDNEMTDLETPNTKPGFCPVCDQRADIWNATKNHWECCYCNWSGQRPNQEKRFKQENQSWFICS